MKITTKEAKSALKTLKDAKKLFKGGKNWIQSNLHRRLGKKGMGYCLVGAVQEADGPGEKVLIEYISDLLGYEEAYNPIEEIETWNDAEDREWLEVDKLLAKAEKGLLKVTKKAVKK